MKRVIAYLLIAIIFAISVYVKAEIIEGKDKKVIVSTEQEWKVNGKPVSVEKVIKGTIINNTRVTGEVRGRQVVVNVPYLIKAKIKKGQKFSTVRDGRKISGTVAYVTPSRDMLSGLFIVKLSCSCDPKIKYGNFLAVDIQTAVLKNVLKIPLAAINEEKGKKYSWIVDKEGVAKKQSIRIGVLNQQYAQVLRGVKLGDMVCISGSEYLKENDKVRIYKRMEK